MARLSADILDHLLEHSSPAAISLYMPVHTAHTPPAIREDQTRFKNLCTQALKAAENSQEATAKDLQAVDLQLEVLQGDLSFWEAQRVAMAVFAEPGQTTIIDLPIDSDEYAAADNVFHLAPLIGLLNYLINYRVVVVSEKEPLLFDGDAYELRSATLPLPASGHSGSLQIRQKRVSHLGTRRLDEQPEYFGGPYPVVNTDERFNFFRVLDRSLQPDKRNVQPLLLAGTDEDIADFRSIATYPRLLAASLPNTLTEQDVQRLAQESRNLAYRELLDAKLRDILARYEQLDGDGSGLASHNPNDVEQAAAEGRIDTLILRMLITTTDAIGNTVHEHTKLTFAARELMSNLNSLAYKTRRTRGNVVLSAIGPQLLPQDHPTASAIFRY